MGTRTGPGLPTMAWRNLWRNRRRTLISVFGISFGVLLAVLFTGIGDSSYAQMIDKAARIGGGHVVVQHPDYDELPSLDRTIANTKPAVRRAKHDPDVSRVVTRISGATMLATASDSYGAFVIAIDPAVEDDTTLAFTNAIAEGEMFPDAQSKGIIIGKVLAENLDTKLGRKIVYTMTDKEGQIVSGLARVSGIVDTGSPSLDTSLCLLPIGAVRTLLSYGPDEATQVAIYLHDHRNAQDVARRLQAAEPEASVLTWAEAQPDLAGFIALKVGSTIVMEVIIMLLLAAGIFNTLFVSVMERLREFGIMIALGFSARQIFGLVMWESTWLALTGLIASVVVTAYPYYYLSTTGIDVMKMYGEGAEGSAEVAGVAMDPILYVRIYPESALVIAVVVVLATMASGLYPAWKAGRASPSEAIRLS